MQVYSTRREGKCHREEQNKKGWSCGWDLTASQGGEGSSCLLPPVVNTEPLMAELLSKVEPCFFKMSGLLVGPSSSNRPPPCFHGTCLHHLKQQNPVFKGEFSGVRQTVKFQNSRRTFWRSYSLSDGLLYTGVVIRPD